MRFKSRRRQAARLPGRESLPPHSPASTYNIDSEDWFKSRRLCQRSTQTAITSSWSNWGPRLKLRATFKAGCGHCPSEIGETTQYASMFGRMFPSGESGRLSTPGGKSGHEDRLARLRGSAVTVAAYTTRNTWTDSTGNQLSVGLPINTICDFSSPGPLRNQAPKPDLTAPGAMIISALSSQSNPDPRNIVAPTFFWSKPEQVWPPPLLPVSLRCCSNRTVI